MGSSNPQWPEHFSSSAASSARRECRLCRSCVSAERSSSTTTLSFGGYDPGDPDRLSAECRTHGIRLLLQFGSTISNHAHAASDIDLSALKRRPSSLEARAELVGDFQALLPGRDVDLALIDGDPILLKKITEQCRFCTGRRDRCTS